MSAAPPASQSGAPDVGTSAAGQTETTPPAAAPPAADQGFDAPFNLADVPEGVREHVERYNKQLQGAFTQKTQGVAEQLKLVEAYAPHLQLLQRAAGDDPQDRIAALNELLDPYGIEIPDEDEELVPPAGEVEPPAGETQPQALQLPPELQQGLELLLSREQQRAVQEQASAQEAFKASVRSSVDTGLETFAKANGYESGDKVPDHIRSAIIDRAIALPKTADGMPDMVSAVAAYEAFEAAVVQGYVQKKGAIPPTPDLTGGAGRAQIDLSDPKQRLAQAEAVAGRHL